MSVCQDCFISFASDLLQYHRIMEHGAFKPEGYVAPISTGHVYADEIVNIGVAGDSYGS